MAIRPEDEYVESTPASAEYPGGSGKNVSSPGGTDGMPFEKAWYDDFFGFFQKLYTVADITPSGVPDTVLASDYYDSLLSIINLNAVGKWYDTSGTASAIILTSPDTPETSYHNGLTINFRVASTITGTTTINVDALGPIPLRNFRANELAQNSILGLEYATATYFNAQFVLTSPDRSGTPGQLIELTFVPNSAFQNANRMLERAGQSLPDTSYPDLLAIWGGKIYGNIDGTHFYLPDDRGLFTRNLANGSSNDPDRATRTDRGDGTTGDNIGTLQEDQNKEHDHTQGASTSVSLDGAVNYWVGTAGGANVTGLKGGNQSNPKNRYVWGGIFY